MALAVLKHIACFYTCVWEMEKALPTVVVGLVVPSVFV